MILACVSVAGIGRLFFKWFWHVLFMERCLLGSIFTLLLSVNRNIESFLVKNPSNEWSFSIKNFFSFISLCKKNISLRRFSICSLKFSTNSAFFYPLDYLVKSVVWPHLIFFLSNTLWLLGCTSHHSFLVLHGNFRLIRAEKLIVTCDCVTMGTRHHSNSCMKCSCCIFSSDHNSLCWVYQEKLS